MYFIVWFFVFLIALQIKVALSPLVIVGGTQVSQVNSAQPFIWYQFNSQSL